MRIFPILLGMLGVTAGLIFLEGDSTAAALPRCTFNNPKTASIAFGLLDPSAGNDVPGTSSAANPIFTFRCTGPGAGPYAFSLTATSPNDIGAVHRLVNINPAPLPREYIPYSFTITIAPPSPAAKNQPVAVSIVGPIVFGADYRNAYWGDYSDTLTLSLSP